MTWSAGLRQARKLKRRLFVAKDFRQNRDEPYYVAGSRVRRTYSTTREAQGQAPRQWSHKGENAMITASTMPNAGTNPMHSTESLISSKRLWASRIMSGLPVLFLL